MALLQKYAPAAIRPLSGEKNGSATGIRFVTAASVADARERTQLSKGNRAAEVIEGVGER
jgi:hypothetical protein